MSLTLFWAFYGLTGIAIGVFFWERFKALFPDLERQERKSKVGAIIMVAILWPVVLLFQS
jgi:hypothetical protein